MKTIFKNTLLKRLLIILLIMAMIVPSVLGVVTQVNAAVTKQNISVFVGDTWSATIKSGSYTCTTNGNNLSKTDTREHATASISGTTLKIKGTSAGSNWFFLCQNNKEVYKKIHVTVKNKPAVNTIGNANMNKGKNKSNDVYLYEGESCEVTASAVAYEAFLWEYENGIKMASDSNPRSSVVAQNTGTYNLSASAMAISSVAPFSASARKSIKVYVIGKKPSLDTKINGTSRTSYEMKKDEKVIIDYSMINKNSSMSISPSLSVNSDSTNKVNIKSLGSGKYEITAKAGFTVGNKANLTYTAVTSDPVTLNNGTSEGTISYTKSISITLGQGSVSSYISLKDENGKDINDITYITKYLNFYPVDSTGSNNFSYSIIDSSIASIGNPVGTVAKCNKAILAGKNKGETKLTVTSTNAIGIPYSRVYTIRNIDVVHKLIADNVVTWVGKKERIDLKGITKDNYYNNNISSVYLKQNALSYSSDNDNVASVDSNGNIIAKEAGTANITVNYKYEYSDKIINPNTGKIEDYKIENPKVTFKVTIYDKITKMEFKTSEKTVKNGERYIQMPVCVPDENVYNHYTWISSNEKIAIVNEKGLVETKGPGSVTITAIAIDGSNTKASYVINVKCESPNKAKATLVQKGIKLTWSKVTRADKYVIYKKASKKGKYSELITTTGNSYKDKKVTYKKTYYYKVVAIPREGINYSSEKGISSIKYLPAPPTIKKIKKSGGGQKITFKSNPYTGIVIYIGKNKKPKKIYGAVSGKTATVFLKKGKTYYIRCKNYLKVGKKKIYSPYSTTKKYKVK